MALVKGTDLRIFVGTKTIANETTCSIDLTTSMIETSSKDSGAWMTQIPGRKSWSLTSTIQLDYADGTVQYTYDELLTAWLDQTELTVSFKTAAVSETTLTGKAFVASKPVTGGDQEIATVEITLQGTGVLTKGTVPAV
jgi:predicted secreted protein